jgi:hypothetical protein
MAGNKAVAIEDCTVHHGLSADDRRGFLTTAGIVGAAAWTAPMLLSEAAHAQGTPPPCTCETGTAVNLLAAPFAVGTNVQVGSYLVNGSTLTFTATNNNTITNTTCTPAANWQTGRITSCPAGGFTGGQIPLVRTGTGNPQQWTFVMNFNPAVTRLSFTLTDIDSSTNAAVRYREQVTISWVGATATPTYAPGSNLVSTGTNQYACVNTTFNAPFDDPSCNLGVTFDCEPVSQVTVVGSDLNAQLGTSGTEGRMVGVTALSYCPVV